jgi:alginate O-acetyltransferase complex protein AlgJ
MADNAADEVPLAPDEGDSEPPNAARRRSRSQVIVAVLGCALFFAPWAAFLAGARSDPVPGENRALAPAPQYHGFATLNDITKYAADHFPLRDAAVRNNKRLIRDIFSEDPSYFLTADNQQVLAGKNHWLYLSDDFNKACQPETALSTVMAGVKRLDAMLHAAGKRLVLAVPPDKSHADPQFLPESFEQKSCSQQARDERDRALRSLDIPGYVDISKIVAMQETQTGKPAFLPFDTHWTEQTAAAFVQAVAGKLDPALADGTTVAPSTDPARSPVLEQGDLAVLDGDAHLFEEQGYDLSRAGVTSESTCDEYGPIAGAYSVNHFTSTTAGPAKLFTPRTTWIGDSFTQRALPKIWPYFSDMTRVPELTKAIAAGNDKSGGLVYPIAQARMLYEISHSDVVVVELVERTFAGVGAYGSMWTDRFLDLVQQALQRPPASHPLPEPGSSCDPHAQAK